MRSPRGKTVSATGDANAAAWNMVHPDILHFLANSSMALGI